MKHARQNHRRRLAAILIVVAAAAVPLTAGETYEWTGGRWAQQAEPVEGTAEGELALVRRLVDGGYAVRVVQPVDMFPQTFHIESVSWFEKT